MSKEIKCDSVFSETEGIKWLVRNRDSISFFIIKQKLAFGLLNELL